MVILILFDLSMPIQTFQLVTNLEFSLSLSILISGSGSAEYANDFASFSDKLFFSFEFVDHYQFGENLNDAQQEV